MMLEREEDQVRCGKEGRHQHPLFYADDVMIRLSDPGWLQGVVSTPVGLFNRVGLKTNIGNTF